MASMPIYDKNIKKSSAADPITEGLETGLTAWGILVTSKTTNDDPGLTLTFFVPRSNMRECYMYRT